MHDVGQGYKFGRGERRDPQFSVERHVPCTVGIIVWEATAMEVGSFAFYQRQYDGSELHPRSSESSCSTLP